MTDEIELLCWVQGSKINHIFPVRVSPSAKVMHLKEAIHQKKPSFRRIDPDALQLWKVCIPLARIGDDSSHLIKLQDGQRLTSMMDISDIWERKPSDDVLSVILPCPGDEYSNISLPIVNDHWSPRSDTVRRLFDTLERRRLVHVRGPPGCGKTTLKELLHAHILKRNPQASVYTTHSWPRNAPRSERALDKRLRSIDPTYPRPSVITFLLFDDGQDLYQDDLLWNIFLKRVHDRFHNNYRVILFCSYGSPSPRPVFHEAGTPLCLSVEARVVLWPTEISIGLLLTRLEFDEVVARYERKLNLHPIILQRIFDWTAGHVGAVVQLLHVLAHQGGSETRQGAQLTVDDFYAENPLHSLIQQLRIKAGPFGRRGLPLDSEISEHPSVATFFRTLLRYGEVEEGVENSKIIHKCHRNGWIYAYVAQPHSVTRYTLASPLHSAVISWIIEPSNMSNYASPFELCFEVISHFKPSQMHIPTHRVGAPNAIDRLPEAQYQHEFYRSVFDATAGNVCISPDFASAKGAHMIGCIDFFIPIVKWGIEIIRDGDRLWELNSRFENLEAYRAWLQLGGMTDYVLIDCCTRVPQEAHPGIPNLFHAVFSNEYREVTLYNNEVNKVGGTIALLESDL